MRLIDQLSGQTVCGPDWLGWDWAGARLGVPKGCCRAFALAGAASAAIPKGAGPELTPKGPAVEDGVVPGCEGVEVG